MKNPLSNAAAKLSIVLASLPLQFAHLRGVTRNRRPPDRETAASERKAPAVAEDGAEEMCGTSLAARARRRERARCAAIILSDAGKRNPAAAQCLAFGSRMTRLEAIAFLSGMPKAACAELGRPRGYWIGRHWNPANAMFDDTKGPHASTAKRAMRPSSSRR